MFLLVVVVVAALGGFVPAFVCAITGFLLANWYFTPPYYEFTISEGENLVALVIFLLVGGVVSLLVATASRRTAEAAQARAEAETLAALSGTLVGVRRPAAATRRAGAGGVRRRRRRRAGAVTPTGSSWQVLASAGDAVPQHPDDADLIVPLHGTEVLVLRGDDLGARRPRGAPGVRRSGGDRGAATRAAGRRRARARAWTEANELRTALLAAVSHDLRTPLSSIKASVSSLLQRDVDFTPGATRELLETIDEGADRLNHLIGNLLDMSRLQTGALQLVMRDVGLDEVVCRRARRARARPIGSTSTSPRRCRACAPTPRCSSAPSPTWSRTRSRGRRPTRACASRRASRSDRVDLHVVDRGPGIPPSQREDVFRPFQRLGDRSNGSGVGLGLAVARGFVEAMGGEIVVDDTPGGGVTMVISLAGRAS